MPLKQMGFIPIPPGPQAGFDHADVYLPPSGGDGRLYVAHTGADCIEVIDCASNTYMHALSGTPGVAGILVGSDHDLLFSSDRGCARVSVYRCSDETLFGRVPVGEQPNGLAYDPGRRRLFVFNVGDGRGADSTVSVVAIDSLEVIKTIPLPGLSRWAVYDGASDRVYVNIKDPAQVAVLNPQALCVERAMHVPASGPHGLGLLGDRLICAADDGALTALNRDTGEVFGTAQLPGQPDVIMLDRERSRAFIAVGPTGAVSVVDISSMQPIETVKTEIGAHTIGWNPDTRTLYAFQPASEGVAVFQEP